MKDKVVIITGASSGIGATTAKHFGTLGARVVLAARRKERLVALADEIGALPGAAALPVVTDVSQHESIQALVDTTLAEFGRVDVLVNNAGFARLNWLDKLDPIRDIEMQVQVNLLGAIYVAQAVLVPMMAQRSGHIINMASVAGKFATPTYTVYAACKYGLAGFAEALRREARAWGIYVSTVFPNAVATKEFAQHAGIDRKTGMTTPSWLVLTPDDVAEAVVGLVRRPRRELILPRIMGPMLSLNRAFPGVVDRMIQRRFVLPERGEELGMNT